MLMDLFPKKLIYNLSSREKPNEKGLFLKRIGMLLENGYSLKEALTFLEKFETGMTEQWIKVIQKGLVAGHPFHQELEKVGFSEKVCSQIYLANEFGLYAKTITGCGEQILESNEKKKKLRSLATYPVILLIFLLGMLILMRYLILPHMETLFINTGSGGDMYSNKIVLYVYYSPQIILGFILVTLVVSLFVQMKIKQLNKIRLYGLLTKVPILRNYLKDYYSQFFFFEWGNLLINGCSFQEVIQMMKGEDASKLLRETGEHMAREMNLGHSIHVAIETLPFFYKEGILVVSHGENLGKLGTEMLVYANHCENQFNLRIEKLMDKIQPLIFILIAVMILSVYAALMLPVFNLMEGF